MPYPFLQTLSGERIDPPPVWFMRQAGRYLPEYRALREKASDFVAFCFDPEKAAEVTLQPIRRFGFDAAILFADILLLPKAMGQEVRFVAGEGPRLSPLIGPETIDCLTIEGAAEKLSPVYETVRRVRAELPGHTALIGFAGAPWTVATYMIAGQGTRDPGENRMGYYQSPETIDRLLDMLTEGTIAYLSAQIDAGAQAVQLFESWASGLPEELYRRFCLAPARRIRDALKETHPDIPVILFQKGAGALLLEAAETVRPDGLGLDYSVPLQWAAAELPEGLALQGALDPLLLIKGGEALDAEIRRQKRILAGRAHIFNLGHGITPQTPIAHVERALEVIREG